MREMQINWKALKADVGGRWFLDRRSLIPLIPFLTITSVLSTSSNQASPGQFEEDIASRYFLLFAANVVSILLCWLYIELAALTVFRNRSVKPIHWIVVLAFGATAGFLKGFTTGVFSFLFGSEANLETAINSRIWQTSILGLWTMPVLALVTATYFKYQNEREALISERIKAASFAGANEAIPDHQKALRAFIAQSKDQIAQLQSQSQTLPNPAGIAKVLRALIEDGLRPISHQIWISEQKSRSGFRLQDLTLLALTKNPFPLLVVALSFGVGSLPLSLVAYPPIEAFARTVVMGLVIIGVYSVFLFMGKTSKSHPILVFFVGNILASTLGILVTATVFGDELTQESVALGLSLLLWLLQITLFASVLKEVLTSRSEVRQELLKLTGKADINVDVSRAANKIASRELAQHVHSNIQNQIMARALVLDNENLTGAEINRQLSEVQNLLDLALETSSPLGDKTLLQRLEEIVARWQGFVRMNLEVELDQKLIDPVTSRTIVQIVSEAISNSVRHGLAQTVSIRISRAALDESLLEITVIDDGLGPRSGAAGLGTELFNVASGGDWQIKALESGGSELKITIRDLAS